MTIKRAIAAILALTACQAPIEPPAPQPAVLDPSRSTLDADRTSAVLANGADAVVLTVTLRDQYGDPMPKLLVSLEVEGDGSALTQPPLSDADGVARGVLRSTRQGVKTVTALVGSSPPIELAQRVAVEFGSGPASLLTFVAQPTSTLAGALLSPRIEVAVQDAFGSPVTSSTMEITLSLSGGRPGTSLDGTTTATVAEGVAAFDDLVVPFAGTGYRLVAQAEGIEPVESAPFDITVGPAAALGFIDQPSDRMAGGPDSPPISIELVDANGNRVTHPPVQVALILRSPPGQNGRLGGETRVETINGVATFNGTQIVTAGKGFTLLALTKDLPMPESAAFDVAPAAPNESRSLLTADATEVLADGVTTTILSLLVVDSYGNRIAGQPVALSVSGGNNLLSPASGITDANGEFIATLASPVAEPKVVTASFDAVELTTAVTFVPGAPSLGRSSFTAASSSVVADGVTTTALTLRVVDESDNPLEGIPVTFAVSGSGHTLAAESEATDADGALFATLASTRAEAKTITASFATHILTQVVVFYPGAPSPATSKLQASPAAAVADGVETCTLTLAVKDAEGNPIAGQAVSLLASGTANTLSAERGHTDSLGEFHSTLASTRAEVKTVTATFENQSLTKTVSFLPGASSLANSTFDAAPASLVADGVSVTTLRVRVLDEFDNPRPEEPVTFSVTGSDNTLLAGGPTTTVDGELTATLASSRAESKTVTVRFANGSLTQHVSFVPGAPSAARSSLAVDPTSLVANGVATATITVRVMDDFKNPITGEKVMVSVSGRENTLDPPSGSTNGAGLFVSRLMSTHPEEKSITAAFGEHHLSEPITFFPIPPDAHTSTVVVAPSSLLANGHASATVNVTVRDEGGRPLPDLPVTLAVSGEGNLFSQPLSTDSEGATFTTLRSIHAGTKTVTATVAGVTLTEQPQVVFNPVYQITGTVSGLTGAGLRVRLIHGTGEPGFDELIIEASGDIAFPTRVAKGTAYSATVEDQPLNQICIIENGNDIVGDGDVNGISVRCGSKWKEIATSSVHALGIKSDGTLWSWGRNESAQLCDGTNYPRARPVLIGSGFKSIGVGSNYSIALKNDGTVWICGNHRYKKSDGTPPDPRTLHMLPGRYTSIAAGDGHTLILGDDGRLWAWGVNSRGQVGDGTGEGVRDKPVQIGSGYVAISARGSVSMGIKSDGSLWGWGFNMYGQIGNGTTEPVTSPTYLGAGFLRVYAGWNATHAIKEGGTVWAWGRNDLGQLGDGTTTDRHLPAPLDERFTKVITSLTHTVALREDGSVWTWGSNAHGQLGDGTVLSRITPKSIGQGFVDIDAFKDTTFAIMSDGAAWAWGSNEGGKYGDGSGWRTQPVQIGSGFSAVAAGVNYSLALKSDGTLWSWGDNIRGQLGLGTLEPKGIPQLVGGGFTSIAAGGNHSVATKEDGTMWSWGGNTNGQLGNGTTVDSDVPVLIGEFASVSARASHTLAIKSDASAWAWGSNITYRGGDGSSTENHHPVLVGHDFLSVSPGWSHALGLRAHGSVWAWGRGQYGSLGNGSTMLTEPTDIDFDAKNISAGYFFNVSIKPDGTLWSWGYNNMGQLGNGTTTISSIPMQIGTGYLSADAGYDFAFANRNTGTLMGWGANSYGQLGLGTVLPEILWPRAVGAEFAQVSGGWRHTLAIKDDGSLWAWGDNTAGAIGDGHGASTVPLFIE